MSSNGDTDASFLVDTIPDEMMNVVGALVTAGWAYCLTPTLPEDAMSDKVRLVISGTPPQAAIERVKQCQPITTTLIHDGDGVWSYDGNLTGLVRDKPNKADSLIDFKTPQQIVNHIGARIFPGMYREIDGADEKPKPAKAGTKALPAGKSKPKAESKPKAKAKAKSAKVTKEEVLV